MTIIELVTKLSACTNLVDAAQAAINSKLAGAKDIYLAWGKEHGWKVNELNQAWKDEQPAKAASASGFTAGYYDWLAEEARSEQEAYDYIMDGTSSNVQNHLTHYLNIWALAETVRSGVKVKRTIAAGKPAKSEKKASKEKEPAWEYDSAHPYQDVKSAWETLKREQAKARPAKTKVHPDKVSHLGDAELTAAYTKAFQIYNK